MKIPFAKVVFSEDEEKEVLECLRSGWITSGPRVCQFEKDFAEFVGSEDAVAVSSGTAALHLALIMLELKDDDEVITPSLTWVSVPNLVTLLGGKPVFCEVDQETLNINLDDLEKQITPKTKAIVPVHYAGRPVDLDAIHALADPKGIYVIEDACHAIGAEYNGQRIGSHSGLCAFSFHPNKNMTTAEGGMLTGVDVEKLKQARLLRFHGISRDTFKRTGSGQLPHYETIFPGLKVNMTDVAASIGIHQLRKVEGFNLERNRVASAYREKLSILQDKIFYPDPCDSPGSRHSWHLATICVEDKPDLREKVMTYMIENGVQVGLHYLPVHLMKGMQDRGFGRSLPVTERIGRTIMSLPLFPGMTENEIDFVVETLKRAIERS